MVEKKKKKKFIAHFINSVDVGRSFWEVRHLNQDQAPTTLVDYSLEAPIHHFFSPGEEALIRPNSLSNAR